MILQIKNWQNIREPGIKPPAYPGDAGLDLIAIETLMIPAGGFTNIPHGFAVAIPEGHFGFVLPRSSTIRSYDGNLAVMASPIDSGYRGQIFTMVRNHGPKDIWVHAGERLSQMVILPFAQVAKIDRVEILKDSERGQSGFGSTGR